MAKRLVSSALAACLCIAASVPAEAASWLEMNFWLSGPNYEGIIPFCQDPRVGGKIAFKFAQREGEYWNSPLRIQGIDRQHEIAYRPWGPGYIPRRFCQARVLTSDGHYRTLSYVIAEDLGTIGATWGVEWCLAGLDRNLAFAPGCRMAQP